MLACWRGAVGLCARVRAYARVVLVPSNLLYIAIIIHTSYIYIHTYTIRMHLAAT